MITVRKVMYLFAGDKTRTPVYRVIKDGKVYAGDFPTKARAQEAARLIRKQMRKRK